MRRLILGISVISSVLSTISFAQNKTNPIVCFVKSQDVLKAHPQGSAASKLNDDARKETSPLETQLADLQKKANLGTITTAERQKADVLVKTLNSTRQKWQDKIDKALAPITAEIDKAVSAAAKTNGCSVVLDRLVAQQSGLVVYAADGTDITDDIITIIKK